MPIPIPLLIVVCILGIIITMLVIKTCTRFVIEKCTRDVIEKCLTSIHNIITRQSNSKPPLNSAEI